MVSSRFFFFYLVHLINHYNIDLDGDIFPNFAMILKKTYNLIKTFKKMAKLGITDHKNNCIYDLVDWYAKID